MNQDLESRCWAFLFVAIVGAGPICEGAVRYVAKSGSNVAPYATPRTASTTIRAACKAAKAGDTIVILDSEVYEECGIVVPQGTVGAYTTLKGAPGQRPTILHSAPTSHQKPAPAAFGLRNCVALDNLIIPGADHNWRGAINGRHVAHVRLTNLIIHDFAEACYDPPPRSAP